MFLFCLLKSKDNIHLEGFWDLLGLFWTADQLVEWKRRIFPENIPEKDIGCCRNLICLSPEVHRLWKKGLFALKPIKDDSKPNEITVEFFWLPKSKHKKHDRVDILTEPQSSRGLTGSANAYILYDQGGEVYKKVESGQSFKIVTENPDTHPLPDYEILNMQWHLQRLVSMSGAVDWCESDFSDSASPLLNYNDTIWNHDTISEWLSDTMTSGAEDQSGNILICV